MAPTTKDEALDPRIERTRRVVREAALAELAESGYGAFAIDSVSARCGVARSTIYRHWPDKLALITDALQTLNRQPAPADEPDDETARQRIHRLVHHLATAFQGSPVADCVPALIEGAQRHDEVRAFHHRYNAERRRALVDAIARGTAAGEVADHVDPDLAATALAGAVVYRRFMTPDPLDPARVDDLVRSVLGDPPPLPPPAVPAEARPRPRGARAPAPADAPPRPGQRPASGSGRGKTDAGGRRR